MKLGDLFSSVTALLGIKECEHCRLRKEALNLVDLKGKSKLEAFLALRQAWNAPEFVIGVQQLYDAAAKDPPPIVKRTERAYTGPAFQGRVYLSRPYGAKAWKLPDAEVLPKWPRKDKNA